MAGIIALPQILEEEKILKKTKTEIDPNELPYDIQIPNELKYHSLFVCPITKEISTPENPPMLLKCGHCVSKKALDKMKLTGTGAHANMIKCPTCPNEQKATEAKELFIF